MDRTRGDAVRRADHADRRAQAPHLRRGGAARGSFALWRCPNDRNEARRPRYHPGQLARIADMTKPALVPTPSLSSETASPDPFDLASLRLNPSFLETAGVKKLL